ncbi:hypothetical protein HDV00_003204 [Rhizophlyctis rosea]|nr:hypothetical protein HDV00_003204 [Rhizophlyctis rosea]
MGVASTKPIFMAGRFLSGFGVTIATTAAPSYVIELAHPLFRGTIGGLYNCTWFIGSIIATWSTYGSKNINNNLSWRIPIWLQLVPSLIMIAGFFIIPESPRWLISVGRTEEARQILIKYHADGNEHSELVTLEFNEMVETIKTDASDKRFWDYSEIFRSRNGRWRFLMVFFVAFYGQMLGNNLISYFQGQALAGVGIVDDNVRFLIMGVTPVVSLIVAQFGARATDKIGRRSLLITGTGVMGLMMTIVMIGAALANFQVGPDGKPSASATSTGAIVFVTGMYLFQIVYAISWTPMQALYPVECLQTSTRAKGLALVQFVVYAGVAFNQWFLLWGLTKLGWKFYILWVVWDWIAAGTLFFFMVETNGLTLEELDEVFDAPNPRKASVQKRAEIQELDY